MDPRRRRLLLSLALAPALTSARPGAGPRAADAATAPPGSPIALRASAGGAEPEAPLRYGDGFTVLRVGRGAPVRIALENRLSAPTSLDLHGIRVPPPLGGAGPLGGTVAPGAVVPLAFAPPDAGTFWFHPWLTAPATDATALGLAGALIVAEDVPPDVDADLVALLSDRGPPSPATKGAPADAFRIDGGPFPRREAVRPGARVRLRLVNASTRQAVTVACRGTLPAVVAIDGQPSALFRPRGDAVPLGPGGRCDLMFDMPRAPEAEVSLSVGTGPAALVLRAEGEPREARGPIVALPANPLLPPAIALERSVRATLVATRVPGSGPGAAAAWAVNGASGVALPKAPAFVAKRGAPVTLTLTNAGPDLVAFRVHGFCLRLLHDRDDGWEPYWQDTVLVGPGATHHAAFVADQPGRRLIESSFFGQAAGGLRTWFEIR